MKTNNTYYFIHQENETPSGLVGECCHFVCESVIKDGYQNIFTETNVLCIDTASTSRIFAAFSRRNYSRSEKKEDSLVDFKEAQTSALIKVTQMNHCCCCCSNAYENTQYWQVHWDIAPIAHFPQVFQLPRT